MPIIIGMFEAQAIAIEIEKIIPNRPMTHDLFKSFAVAFDFSIREIIINDLREGVFFAKIICIANGKEIEVDARPSDAIAIGLRFNAEIFTHEPILSEAGITLSEEYEEEMESAERKPKSASKKPFVDQLEDFNMEKLNEMLEKALKDEDYEKAAKIRDEINKRN